MARKARESARMTDVKRISSLRYCKSRHPDC